MTSGLIYMLSCKVVSEAPGLFEKNQKCVKKLSKFIGMRGIDNRLKTSPSKCHKIPENISYFKTYVNTMSADTPQISPTGCNANIL